MGFREWIIPKNQMFFDLLEKEARNLVVGAETLVDLLKHYENIEDKRSKLKQIEHEGDHITHQIHEELNLAFITPLDHDDISKLSSHLDDILDYMDDVARMLVLYRIQEPKESMIELARVIMMATYELENGIKGLRDMKNPRAVEACCVETNRLENYADDLFGRCMTDVFSTQDVFELIKLKDLYERLEQAIDACEDAANAISDIVVKQA
ncbi:MAG: DUF47 domain-containing protein [Methermicoccaceae archaeon]